MQIKRTRDISSNFVKILVYGAAGSGKTRLSQTLNNALIISAEGGLLSLDADMAYVDVASMSDLWSAYEMASRGGYDSVVLDSLSEIAEIVLSHEKKTTKDGRAAYGNLNEKFIEICRGFRSLPMDVYMTAKMDREQDESGRMLYSPAMPGKTLSREIMYQFDEVFCLRKEIDSETGESMSALMCVTDGVYQAKDRSGACELWEAPDLGAIIEKIKQKKAKNNE
jgi:phage nucleotide-binding protein